MATNEQLAEDVSYWINEVVVAMNNSVYGGEYYEPLKKARDGLIHNLDKLIDQLQTKEENKTEKQRFK